MEAKVGGNLPMCDGAFVKDYFYRVVAWDGWNVSFDTKTPCGKGKGCVILAIGR